jgi:hypothetical protein
MTINIANLLAPVYYKSQSSQHLIFFSSLFCVVLSHLILYQNMSNCIKSVVPQHLTSFLEPQPHLLTASSGPEMSPAIFVFIGSLELCEWYCSPLDPTSQPL